MHPRYIQRNVWLFGGRSSRIYSIPQGRSCNYVYDYLVARLSSSVPLTTISLYRKNTILSNLLLTLPLNNLRNPRICKNIASMASDGKHNGLTTLSLVRNDTRGAYAGAFPSPSPRPRCPSHILTCSSGELNMGTRSIHFG